MSPSISGIKNDVVAAAKANTREIISVFIGVIGAPVVGALVKRTIKEIKGE